MKWYLAVLKKYVDFKGRARRKEFWMFVLFNIIISVVLSIVGAMILSQDSAGLLSTVYSLGVLLPAIGVSVRRLHDTNRSGWWLLIAFIPIVGAIVLLVFYATEGTKGDNQYGSDPKLLPEPA